MLMNLAIRIGPAAESAEVPRTMTIEDGLGHDRTRRIAVAQEKDVTDAVGTLLLLGNVAAEPS
jgi:hypothetical protein